MKKYLFCLLAALLFTGCIYEESQDYSKFINKTTYESFEDLNDPLVLNLNLDMLFNLSSNKENSRNVKNGSIFVIYDWENQKIHDYVYAPGYSSRNLSDLSAMISAKSSDGKLKFFANDDVEYNCLYLLDSSKTSLSTIDYSHTNWTANWSQTFIPSDRYLISFYHKDSENSDSQEFHFTIVDADQDSINQDLTLENISSSHDNENLIQDSEGNFWLIYLSPVDENNKRASILRKIDISSKKIEDSFLSLDRFEGKTYSEDEWDGYIDYSLLTLSDSYLLLGKYDSSKNGEDYDTTYSIVTVDKDSKELNEISLEGISNIYSVKAAFEADDNFYLIIFTKEGEDINSYLYKLDSSSQTLSEEASLGICQDNLYETFAQRGNIIFKVSYSLDNTSASILSYDISTGTLSSKKEISLSSL
ncbi:MAG: hypothetical protein K5866_08150 [Treponema sp.]|nr:hypothetical protein [Treponema sp.]